MEITLDTPETNKDLPEIGKSSTQGQFSLYSDKLDLLKNKIRNSGSDNEKLEMGRSKILRVMERIRETDPSAYEPMIASIGPYHANNPRLRKMVEIKFHYLRRFLKRNLQVDLEAYHSTVKFLMSRSTNYYAEDVNMADTTFSSMLLIDGCFIIELLLAYLENNKWEKSDPIFSNTLRLSLVEFDLLLFDNQIPLEILEYIYGLFKTSNANKRLSITPLVVPFFRGLIKDLEPLSELPEETTNFYHLLHLFHACFIIPPMKGPVVEATESTLMTPCATDLKNVGIKFRLIENTIFNWNLSPKNGIIEISPARLNSNSNSFYRNLVIFEQYFFPIVWSRVMTYVMFMSCLIDSEADLTLLREKRIVMYTLNHKEATTFFRKLCTDSIIDYDKSYLSRLKDISVDVWKIYDTKWARYKAYVKQTFFSDPLTMVYLVASAVFVIALTLLQTLYTLLSYYQDKNKVSVMKY